MSTATLPEKKHTHDYYPITLEALKHPKTDLLTGGRSASLDRRLEEIRPLLVANAAIPYGINEYSTFLGPPPDYSRSNSKKSTLGSYKSHTRQVSNEAKSDVESQKSNRKVKDSLSDEKEVLKKTIKFDGKKYSQKDTSEVKPTREEKKFSLSAAIKKDTKTVGLIDVEG